VLGESPVRNVLFVIDACNAAAGAGDIASAADELAAVRPRGGAPGAGTWVMASARHRDIAADGAFAAELVRAYALGDGPSQRFLSPALIAHRVNQSFQRAGRRQRAACSSADQSAQPPFFTNPAFDPSAEADTHGRLSGDAADRSSHFEPRGRGVEHVHDTGSYFTGRGRAIEVVRAHLAAADERRLPVPAVSIRAGDLIRDDMITERAFAPNVLGVAMFIEGRQVLVGRMARRALLPGQPIPTNAVEDPWTIARGAMVKVVVEDSGLSIVTYGAAMQAGAPGSLITVRNTDTGVIIRAIVQPDGTVKVADGS